MKNLLLSEGAWNALKKFLARADLKGHEVPEFARLIQELERAPEPTTPVSAGSRPA